MDIMAFLVTMTLLMLIVCAGIQISKYHKCTRYSPIQEDGFQYCSECNKAHQPKKGCDHKWIEQDKSPITRDKATIGYLFILRCKNCGEMKDFKTEVNK